MIISPKTLAKEKFRTLEQGYSVFAETGDIQFWLEKEINKAEIPIHIEKTELGKWYTPQKAE